MKNYILFLRPHANARYEAEAVRLAASEAEAFLPGTQFEQDSDSFGVPCLRFSAEPEKAACLDRHSLLYMLCEIRGDGSFAPALRAREDRVGRDLASILKYSGKTNESFTKLLLNMTQLSGAFSGNEKLSVLDPMCGRCTTLFTALNAGWDAYGCDTDRKALDEACAYFKRYLEYHKLIHETDIFSVTAADGKGTPARRFRVYGSRAEQKQRGGLSLCCARLDTRDAAAFGREKFHLIVCDLPYGVQHRGQGAPVPELLEQCLEGWYRCLKRGGAAGVSFNANTFPRERAAEAFGRAGFTVRDTKLRHWVEQAITRDAVIAVKE